MPTRKVFGKRARAQYDAFASMLYSSPDSRAADVTTAAGDQGIDTKQACAPEACRKKEAVLQAVSVNVARPAEKQTPRRKTTQQQPATTVIGVDRPIGQEVLRAKKIRTKTRKTSKQTSGDEPGQQRLPKQTPGAELGQQKPSKQTPEDGSAHQRKTTTKPAERCTASICPYIEHCRALLDLFRQGVEDFSNWSSQLSEHLELSKIAEASYGEVYRLSLKADLDSIHVGRHEESVLKVIALTPPESTLPTTKRERNKMLKKAAAMSKPADVASEIRLLQRMSNIPGYTDFREMRVLQGRPTGAFVKAYKQFNAAQIANGKEPSIFPDPAKKASYSTDQLWAVIEMRDAGSDLERLVEQSACRDVWSIWDIFWQTTLALAKGEEGVEFEHRDLHLGNICVRSRGPPEVLDTTKSLNFTRLDVTLIDYTISRATMKPSTDIAHLNLSRDQYIFKGDSTHEYQYDIYRYMRSALYHDDALAHFDTSVASTRTWSQFHPQTNVIWLHFVLHTLLQQIESASVRRKPTSKAERLLSKRAKELEQVLIEVNDLLNPRHVIKNGLRSASMLVTRALERQWLCEGDVLGAEVSVVDLVKDLSALEVDDTEG